MISVLYNLSMIKLYLTDVSDINAENKRLLEKISAERRGRIIKTVPEIKRKQLLGAGLLLRHVLILNGLDTEINYTENGKPFKDGIKFSLSHSGKYVLLATANGEIGTDIERIDKTQDLSIAKRIFAPGDIINIDTYKFFSMFTALESYGKMTGSGLFSVLKTPMSEIKNVHSFSFSGYFISVCTEKNEEITFPPVLLKF